MTALPFAPMRLRLPIGLMIASAFGFATVAYGAGDRMPWPVVDLDVKPDWPVVYPDDSISILLAGDTGFGGHGQPVRDGYAMRHGRPIPFKRMSQGIAGLLSGDAAFANLETVVSDHNRQRPAGKRFVFRSHPSGVRHLANLGFNLFSTSNNHVGDYRSAGVLATIDHLDALRREGHTFVAAGLGRNRLDAATPKKIKVKNADLYLSAVGIGGGTANRRGASPRAGHLHYRTPADFEDALAGLQSVTHGYRMLSVHYGEEGQVYPSHRDVTRLRDTAVRDAGIDLVIGHHAHVPRGVAKVGDKLIFYGLGNFMHPGMQNMARFGRCRDFGLVARVHLGRISQTSYRAMAVEVIPITDMHEMPRVMGAQQARVRIGVLNGLAVGLDHPTSQSFGVRFAARPDGTGLACFEGSETMSGVIGRMCARNGRKDGSAKREMQPEIEPAISCGGRRFKGARYQGASTSKRHRYSKRRKHRQQKKPSFFKPLGYSRSW